MIEEGKPDSELRKYIANRGFKTMREDAALKAREHVSTKDEMAREGVL